MVRRKIVVVTDARRHVLTIVCIVGVLLCWTVVILVSIVIQLQDVPEAW